MGSILHAIELEADRGGAGRLTNVAARANVAYDRFQAYLLDLTAAGLITMPTGARVPALTPKGHEFLRHYREWIQLLDRFGLAVPDEAGRAGMRASARAPATDAAPMDS